VRHKSNIRAITSHVHAVRDLRPDLLLVCLAQLYSAQYALLAAVMNRVPTVAVVHCFLPSTHRSQNLIFRTLSRRVRAFGGGVPLSVHRHRGGARPTARLGHAAL
jgi:hypothetical protein